MSPASKLLAGLILVLVPTIEFGGLFLLWMTGRREPGYHDNPVRRALFRAGHAHAGVLVILALVALLYIDQTSFSDSIKTLVRWGLFAAPLLVSGGFFASVAHPRSERPNQLIVLTYLGATVLAACVITLGVGLFR